MHMLPHSIALFLSVCVHNLQLLTLGFSQRSTSTPKTKFSMLAGQTCTEGGDKNNRSSNYLSTSTFAYKVCLYVVADEDIMPNLKQVQEHKGSLVLEENVLDHGVANNSAPDTVCSCQ